jgi:hypothetical protein
MTGETQWQRAGATNGAEGQATGCEAQRQAAPSSICDAAAVVSEPMGKDDEPKREGQRQRNVSHLRGGAWSLTQYVANYEPVSQ